MLKAQGCRHGRRELSEVLAQAGGHKTEVGEGLVRMKVTPRDGSRRHGWRAEELASSILFDFARPRRGDFTDREKRISCTPARTTEENLSLCHFFTGYVGRERGVQGPALARNFISTALIIF